LVVAGVVLVFGLTTAFFGAGLAGAVARVVVRDGVVTGAGAGTGGVSAGSAGFGVVVATVVVVVGAGSGDGVGVPAEATAGTSITAPHRVAATTTRRVDPPLRADSLTADPLARPPETRTPSCFYLLVVGGAWASSLAVIFPDPELAPSAAAPRLAGFVGRRVAP
jgi:hypothetical protein